MTEDIEHFTALQTEGDYREVRQKHKETFAESLNLMYL